ncbi:MAG: hypothetical protein AB1634_14355 [Thermodesulfobacteriota bacterium]
MIDPRNLTSPTRELVPPGVQLITDEVTRVDPEEKRPSVSCIVRVDDYPP